MHRTLPALSIPLSVPCSTQSASATVETPHQPIPTVRSVNATLSAADSPSDASTSTIRNTLNPPSTSPPLAPRPLTTNNASRKRLVPKKSRLGLLNAVKGNKERPRNDFSDVVRRIGGATSAGRGGYEIHVDHAEGPDLEEVVLVKRKKSRLGLDAVTWGPGEDNAGNILKSKAIKPKASENVLKPKSSANILKSKSKDKDKENSVRTKPVERPPKPKADESQKWWSISRGRKDSKEQKETHRSKSPEPEKKSLRARFGSLDSRIMLSSPTSASHPHTPYSFGTNPSQTLLTSPLQVESEPRPTSLAEGRSTTPAPGLPASHIEREVSGSGSIALRAMRSMKSIAGLTSWSQPKADERETKKEKADQRKDKEGGVEKKRSKKSKEKKARGGTVKMSTSSFEAGSISDAGISKVSLEVPPEDNVPRTVGKKQSVLGLGLPSSLRFRTVRSATTSSITDAKEERPPTGTVRRTSVGSIVSLKLLSSRRPSSTLSNSSSLRPPSTASGKSRSSSGSASVKWDEEGLETVKEMRKKDREERRRNSADSNAVLYGTTKKGSKSSAEGRKRPLVSDLFPEVDANSRPTSPEVQFQRSSVISKEGPIINIETATNDGHGHASDLETPVKRARPRPMSEQMLSNTPRPHVVYDNAKRAVSMSLLDAATDDLASLINRLDLEATPRTPDVSPFASVQRSLANRGSSTNLESPSTRVKRFRTTTGSPLRVGLLNRSSTTTSAASLRPYVEGKCTRPKSDAAPVKTKKPQSGNEHLVGQHISPWEDLNWNVSPIKKGRAPSPSARPTHKRALSPPIPFDPPPVFQPLYPPKNRVASNLTSTKNSPETKSTELRPSTPLDGNQHPQVPTSTFGQRPNKISRNGPGSSGGPAPAPVFSRGHSRNKSSLDSNKLFGLQMASETNVDLGSRGTAGSTSLPDTNPEDPDSDIPQDLQFIFTGDEEHADTLSFTEPVQATSLPPTLTATAIPPAGPIPVFRARVFHADSSSGDSDNPFDEDTKKSFDFTGEIRILNELGASDRRSFVEQLENAFRSPARIDLTYSFPDNAMDISPVPALPTDIQDSLTSTAGLPTSVDDFFTDDAGVSDSHDTIPSDEEEYCRRLSSPMDSPSVDIVRERPGNPLASSKNSRSSDRQLDRGFKFGGSPMHSQRSGNSCSEGVSEVPLTLSDIIPPHSHHSRNNSRTSLVEEDSYILKSIMAQANTVLPVASEVAVPRVRPRVESNNSVRGLFDKFSRYSTTSQVSSQGQPRISFAGFDSFDEVRRGFEFGPNRPAFYPPTSFSREYNKHDSIFSVASVSSYGSVINNGAPDPFGYSRHNRPLSEDTSISMSMSVDDTFSFMYQKRRSRVDSDASSFYFKSQPSMMGPIRRAHRTYDSIVSPGSAPPVSLYNRSHLGQSHRRVDSSGSVSSAALSYALHGAGGGRATWAKHSRNSIDSMISDHSLVRLSRPGLGDKMLDPDFDHGVPLSVISASPNHSLDSGLYDQYRYQERTAFDSIMDAGKSMTRDSLIDDNSGKVSSTDSVFFKDSRVSSEGYSVQSHFRPVSSISVDSSHHAPREDDTMISMLGGGRVRRISMGSLMQQSPCARVEKRGGKKRPAMPKAAILPKPEPVEEVEPAEEEEISPGKSIIIVKPSIASVTSTEFGGERMIKAKKGLLDSQSLEESCLIADGEEPASFAQELSFTRPRPGTTGRSRSSTFTTSSSGSNTPPLSSDTSSFDGSQSSIDVGQLNYLLSNVTHPTTRLAHGRTRARGQGHDHRRRPPDVRHSMGSVYETIQEEGLGSPDPGDAPEIEIPAAVYNSVHSVHIADHFDGTDTEWDGERGFVTMRRYGALKNEADDAIVESRRAWLDTPFSLFAVQTFQPPHHPSGMKAMLENSQKTYGPLPPELRCHRVRPRTHSRPSPYPQRTVRSASPARPSPRPPSQKQETTVTDIVVSTIRQPLQPKSVNVNSKTPALVTKDLNTVPPSNVEFEKSFNERTTGPRSAALGWNKRNAGKSSELKENTSIGTLNNPAGSLRLSRPRPRGRPTLGTGARTRGAENAPPVPPAPALRI